MSAEQSENTVQSTQEIPGRTTTMSSSFPGGSSGVIRNSDLELETVSSAFDEDIAEFLAKLEKCGKRYQILKLLATGGFSRIFLAQDQILGRKVVIKALRENLQHDPEALKRFIAEAKLNAQLDHPAIVSQYSLEKDGADGLNLAMQLINGITLKEFLRRTRKQHAQQRCSQRRYNLLLRERLDMFLRVCDALEYSHSCRIIHCDLKPENIMIGHFGVVYVMDWGIACREGTWRKERITGTPAYMAPEALCDGATTQQTDVFALGMILNEIATLRKCVSGADSVEVARKICGGQFAPSVPFNARWQLAPALRAIIEKARAINPARRYPDVKHLADDVRRYLMQEEVKACPDSLLQKLMRLMYHHRYVTIGILAGLLCALAGVTVLAQWRENRIVRQVNREMVRSLKLQSNTERLATELDSRLLLLQTQLRVLSNSLSLAGLESNPLPGENIRLYSAADFSSGATDPAPGLLRLPYYDQEVSWETPSFLVPENLPVHERQRLGKRFQALQGLNLTYIFEHIPQQDVYVHSREANMKSLLERGSLLRRITYILNNGFAMRFPGMNENVSSPAEFLNDWVRERYRRPPRRLLWSPPYLDSSNHVVISCWRPLLNREGREVGFAGFEVCFHELVRPLWEQSRKEQFRSTYILLDSEDRQIFSSDDRNFEASHLSNSSQSMLLRPPFRDPALLKRIRESNSPQLTTEVDGRPIRISRGYLGNPNWTLLQFVPLDATEVVDQALDEEKRSIFRREIMRREDGKLPPQ